MEYLTSGNRKRRKGQFPEDDGIIPETVRGGLGNCRVGKRRDVRSLELHEKLDTVDLYLFLEPFTGYSCLFLFRQ